MITIKAFDTELTIDRFLAKKFVSSTAPTMVLLAGIHGNEVSGVFAIQNVWKQIQDLQLNFTGNFYAVAGNMNAMSKGIRYENVDLNRLWTEEHLEQLENKQNDFTPEEVEQKEIFTIIKDILATHKGDFYFIDLHTTSSPTTPFITISDSIDNRCFSTNFPLPIVLGIEEYIPGPLLTYINEFGHIGVGFEAGQHSDKKAIKINESFIWLSLLHTGCIQKETLPNYDKHRKTLKQLSNLNQHFFEIIERYSIDKDESFKMKEGFQNFQKIKKGEILAKSDGRDVIASSNGRIFMPLYQSQGDDGYFIIKHISKIWMLISKLFRRLSLYNLLNIFPGVNSVNSYTLKVSNKAYKYLGKQIFHLFGYRSRYFENNFWIFTRRDRKISSFK